MLEPECSVDDVPWMIAANDNDPADRFTVKLTWTAVDGTPFAVTVSDVAIRTDALATVVDLAKACGWTRPQWWQVWRWFDPRVPEVVGSRESSTLAGGTRDRLRAS